VENEYTSHNFNLFAIFLPKIIKIGLNLTMFCQKQFCTAFLGHCVESLGYRMALLMWSYV